MKPTSLDHLEYVKVREPQTGLAPRPPKIREEWLWDGVPHSVDDHPSVIINGGEEMQWHTHGIRNRPESCGPAWIKSFETVSRWEVYYQNGEIHRKNGPAWLSSSSEKWYCRGALHRADGPAVITCNISNRRSSTQDNVEWWWDGMKANDFDHWLNLASLPEEEKVFLKLKYG